MCEVIGSQHLSESFDRQRVPSAAIAKQMTASACLFDLTFLSTGHGGTASADHRNAIARAEGGGKAGVAITADHDLCVRPDALTNRPQLRSVVFGFATGEEDADSFNVSRQL